VSLPLQAALKIDLCRIDISSRAIKDAMNADHFDVWLIPNTVASLEISSYLGQ